MVDDFTIRKLTQDLQGYYASMEAKKYTPDQPQGERTMKPSPGPRMPGNFLWISRSVEMEQRLREVGFNAFQDIHVKLKDEDGKVHNLLQRIHNNAFAISELPWAVEFVEELDDQARQIGKWLYPPEVAALIRQPEKYVDIETITRNLNQRGHQVTNRQARDVAVYNQFDMCKFTDGRNGYKLLQFLHHYEKAEKE